MATAETPTGVHSNSLFCVYPSLSGTAGADDPVAFLAMQKQILEQIAADDPLPSVLAAIVLMVENQASGVVATVMLLQKQRQTLSIGAAPSLPGKFAQLVDELPVGPAVGCCGTAAFSREPAFSSDIAADPRWPAPYKRVAQECGLVSCWSFPLLARSGDTLGTFALYASTRRLPTEHEHGLVQAAVHLAGIAIERAGAHLEIRHWRKRYEAAMASFDRVFYVWQPLQQKLSFQGDLDRIFGYGAHQQPLTMSDWRGLAHPEDIPIIEKEVDKALLERRPFTLRYRVRTGDNQYLQVEDQGHFVLDENGAIDCVAGFISNVTEQTRLQASTLQTQRLDAMGQLASSVAHDFANLLMVVRGNCELLSLMDETSSAQQELLGSIKGAASRATELTRQLLVFSHSHADAGASCDLNEALSGLEELLQRMLPERMRLSIELAASPLEVDCQRGRIDQVLTNLALNSRDAIAANPPTREGQITLRTDRVRLSSELHAMAGHLLPGEFALIEAQDNGCGIAPEALPHVFEPFFTTKSSDQGTGLGLATVYAIVRQMEGAIDVESSTAGTTVRIYLPLAAPAPGDDGEPDKAQAGQAAAPYRSWRQKPAGEKLPSRCGP